MEQMSFGSNGDSRADQIFKRFATFHKANPHVWTLFCQFANDMREIRDRYSAKATFERVRWEIDFTITSETDVLKMNNDFTAYYARMFLVTHPQAEKFFELRRRTSSDRSAFKDDLIMYYTGPAIDEEALMAKLKELADEHSG